MEKQPLFEGDGILFFCDKAKGFIFSPPPLSSSVSSLSIHCPPGDYDYWTSLAYPGLTNVHYAAFRIYPKRKSRSISNKDNKKLVFGRKIYLCHVASKRYLSFKTEDSPKSYFVVQATLVEWKDSEVPTVFRIIPSDSSKSNGQTILSQDVVRLQIVEPGDKHHVLCVPFSLAFKDYELRKALDGSDFILYSQSTVLKEGPQSALRGGDVVMFQNEKRDAFITAMENKVMARVMGGADIRAVFSEWTNFWQIESQAIQYDGNMLGYGTSWPVHIKHFSSKRYLALNTESTGFTLLENSRDERCAFCFEESQIEPNGSLQKRRYVLLKHVKSNCYVTVEGNDSQVDNGRRCFKIIPKPSSDALGDQHFWIEEINQSMLKEFSTLSGTLTSLQKYIHKLNSSELSVSSVVPSTLTNTLQELEQWTRRDSRWPDMLRAIDGVGLLLQFLNQPKESPQWIQCLPMVLGILKNYFEFGSEESLKYLLSTDIMKILFQLIGHEVDAEDTLCALIKCQYFERYLEEGALKQIITDIGKPSPTFAFLKCFSALCVAGGRPVKTIQKLVMDAVIKPATIDHEMDRFHFFKFDEENLRKAEIRDHLVDQIDLYTSVCLGVNMYCIDIMTKQILTYNAAKTCMNKCEDLQLKSAFYRYRVAALVDKNLEESGTDLENIWHSYHWSRFIEKCDQFSSVRLSGIADTHQIQTDEVEEMKKMQGDIEELLRVKTDEVEEMKKMQGDIEELLRVKDWSKQADIELITQKLSVLETLVNYGFYFTTESRNEQHPVPLTVPDVITKLINKLIVSENTKSEISQNIQSKIIKVLTLFLHQTYYLATSRMIYDYCCHSNSNVTKTYPENFPTPNGSFENLLKSEGDGLETPHSMCWSSMQKKARERLRWLLYEERVIDSPGQHLQTHPSQTTQKGSDYDYQYLNVYDTSRSVKLEDLLVDFIGSDDEDLSTSAAILLFDLYQGEAVMLKKQQQVFIITTNQEIYNVIQRYSCFQDKKKLLKKLIQGNFEAGTDELIKDIKEFLYDKVVYLCGTRKANMQREFPRDETFSSKTNQDILVATGIFGQLLNYVVKYATSDDNNHDEVVKAVCDAIITIIKNNNNAKQVVFARFQDLLHARQGIQSVAHLLTEVLTDNIELCRKLPLSFVKILFRKAMRDEQCQQEFIPTLEAWMKVSKSSPHLLKKHQRFVASLIDQFLKDQYSDLSKLHDSVMELLKDDKKKDQFVLLMHLLAVCTEGTHKYSEDIVRAFLKISSLSKIISDELIPFENRLPFVMIMKESFIIAERESLVSVMELACDKCIWKHVSTMIKWLEIMDKKLNELKESGKLRDRKIAISCQAIKIKMIFSQHMTHRFWRDHRLLKISSMKYSFDEKIDEITASNTQRLAILYQYIIEGLLPMLSAFTEEFTKISSSYKDDRVDKLLTRFGAQLKAMVTRYPMIFVTCKLQKEYFEAYLKPILLLSKEPLQEYTLHVEPSTEDNKEQDTINTEFKVYCNNFRKALFYQDEEEEIDKPLLYPRGPGFEQLMKCFDEPKLNTRIGHLINLLRNLHKCVDKLTDNKKVNSMQIEQMIRTIQIMSYTLHRRRKRDQDFEKLREVFLNETPNLLNTCMLLMNLDNDRIMIQIFGLLTLLTANANQEAQDQVFTTVVSNNDSIFCQKVYCILESVSATFTETWAMEIAVEPQNQPTTQNQQQQQQQRGHRKSVKVHSPYGGTLELNSLDEAISSVGIVLDCVSAFCDGQHKKMQQYLLDQDQCFKKLDIIEGIAILLGVLTEEYEKILTLSTQSDPKRVFNYLDLIQKTIQALIETTSGNFDNQEAVFRCQITDTINDLIRRLIEVEIPMLQNGWNTEKKTNIMIKKKTLNRKAFELLKNLLEETNTQSQSLINHFLEDVDLNDIMKSMFIWEEIEAYHILQLVANNRDFNVDDLVFTRLRNKIIPKDRQLWEKFKARSCCIEVMYKPDKHDPENKILTRVYFEYDPLDKLSDEHKDTVTNAISEETQEKRLTEFNAWGRAIRKNASYRHTYFDKKASAVWKHVYRVFFELSAHRNLILSGLTILLNILTLATFVVPQDHTYNATGSVHNWILYSNVSSAYFPVQFVYFPVIFSILLGIIHVILSVLMYVEFIVDNRPNFITKAKNIRKLFDKWLSRQEMLNRPKEVNSETVRKYDMIDLNASLDDIMGNKTHESNNNDDEDCDGYFKIDFFGFQSLYRLIFLLSSIAAMPLRGYPYCICLFYVFLKVDVVQYMLEALTRARKQLCFVFLIAAAILLVFAMGAFIFLHDFFDPSTPLFCNSLWECYISVTREGLLKTVGVAIPFTIPAQGDEATPSYNSYALRSLFFDIPFFIIVTTIVLNIVTAVLIDRFSALREERDKVESNKKKTCFICGLEAEKFEREAKGFNHHVTEDHNKWNYIYYLIYLDRKEKNDRTALENQIADNNPIESKYGKVGHYPITKAKILIKEKKQDAKSTSDNQDQSVTSTFTTEPLESTPPTQSPPAGSLESTPPTQSCPPESLELTEVTHSPPSDEPQLNSDSSV